MSTSVFCCLQEALVLFILDRRALLSEVIKMLILWFCLVLLMHYQCGVLCCLSFSLIICTIGGCVSLPLYRNMTMCLTTVISLTAWLSLPSLIKYCSLCVMHKIYYSTNVPLNPPISFGSSHAYRTRWSDRFIQPLYC